VSAQFANVIVYPIRNTNSRLTNKTTGLVWTCPGFVDARETAVPFIWLSDRHYSTQFGFFAKFIAKFLPCRHETKGL
jgi:hypothetical protein